MKTNNQVFCKERTYILECLLRQDPDYFLEGDWYDMFYSSTIVFHENGEVEVSIMIPAIEALIIGTIGRFVDIEDLFKITYKNIHADKVDLFISDYSSGVVNCDEKPLPIKLKRDVRRIVVKKMREAFKNRDHIWEEQEFNDMNIYDGDDIIGFRG